MSLFENGLSASSLAFVVAVLSCLVLRRLAPVLGLMDRPGGRKRHAAPTPLVGGLALVVGLAVVWLMVPGVRPHPAWVLALGALVVLGVLDDRHPLSASLKFYIQAFVATGVVVLSDLALPHLGDLAPGWDPALLWLAVPFSVFAVLSVINAINMVDGVDGLAGSLSLVATGTLAAAAFMVGAAPIGLGLLALACALIGFLVFNAPLPGGRSARVFMGDAGSMGVGLLIACYALELSHPAPSPAMPAVVALWACAVPLADGLSVILRRRARGAGATHPGRDHLHHWLLDRGLSTHRVLAVEVGASALIAALGLALWRLGVPEWAMVWIFAGALLSFHAWQKRCWGSVSRQGLDAEASASSSLGDPPSLPVPPLEPFARPSESSGGLRGR